jgi:PleD family two-component response regulator
LRIGVSSYQFKNIGQKTASFGVAEMNKNDGIKSLIKKADQALYLSKELGKNSVN